MKIKKREIPMKENKGRRRERDEWKEEKDRKKWGKRKWKDEEENNEKNK